MGGAASTPEASVPRSPYQIPTVRQAVDTVLVSRTAGGIKSHADFISALKGTSGRVVGRVAAGPALGQSELGGLRFDRISVEQLDRWFLARFPLTLAPDTRKRGMSALRQL